MISNPRLSAIKAAGRLETFENDIRTYAAALETAPLWRPGAALKKQCQEALRQIASLEEGLERKLLVSIVGPCGSGKSTLLNALAGADGLSESGHNRPTTRKPVILCRDKEDAFPLCEQLGMENVEIRSSPAASALEHVLLIDTPDTDSMEQKAHIPLVHKAIELSDVLICVFNAENPKTKDYADFLWPYIKKFNGESLVCVANKCDRLDEKELKEVIVPGFLNHVGQAWERSVKRVLCISARRHLHQPDWDPKAKPRHDFDQFQDLQNMIFSTFDHPGYVIDRRIENARSLRDYVIREIRRHAETDRQYLEQARNRIAETEQKAAESALSALRSDDPRQMLGVNVLLYQKLAQRWIGPVGWLIAVWARILIFGTGIAAIFRFGNPVRQLIGIVSSFWHFKDSQAAVAEVNKGERVSNAFRDYRLAVMRSWPHIAEGLVKGRFDPSVRKIADILPDHETLDGELSAIWGESLDSEIEASAKRLSGIFMQFVFNLPVIAIMAYSGWLTARAFFQNHYLSSDFFLHAFLTVAIVLFLCFFTVQGCVRLFAGTERISEKAFERVKKQIEQFHPLSLNPAGVQASAVAEMAAPEAQSSDYPVSL